MIGVDRPQQTGAAMPAFDSDGVRIAYSDEGAGEPVLLIHGFASSMRDN
jgi:pimeloyl-ACP methyl ester carboxylesterase